MNKGLTISFYILTSLLLACSKNIDLSESSQTPYDELTPETIETDLLVLNFTVDPDDFNYMYTNYEDDIEIIGELCTYSNHTLFIDHEEVEIEIKGRTTNYHSLKTLGIEFDNTYHNDNKHLFGNSSTLPNHSLSKIKAFRLRNSGNDYSKTMIKDLCYSKLAVIAGINVELLYGEPVIAFVNNEFYGLLNMRTESNADGLSRLIDEDDDDISLVEIVHHEAQPITGNLTYINSYLNAIETGDLEYLKSHTDLDNFIDYVIFETFIANGDWPYINARFYAINDGPFRFVLFDLDLCSTINLEKDPEYFINPPDIETPISDLFSILYSDEDFKTQYDDRYEELLSVGSFSSHIFENIVEEQANKIEHAIDWQIQKHGAPYSKIEWYRQVDIMKESYDKRLSYFD